MNRATFKSRYHELRCRHSATGERQHEYNWLIGVVFHVGVDSASIARIPNRPAAQSAHWLNSASLFRRNGRKEQALASIIWAREARLTEER